MPLRLSWQKGYTLVEILIVLFIISIVTSVALLTIGHNDNKKMEAFANELTQMVTLAEEQAMLQPAVLGVTFNQHSFQFASLQMAADDKKNNWVAFQDTVLKQQTIPHGIQVTIHNGQESSSNKSENKNPQIIVSPNGDVTPFTIYIGKVGKKPSYAVVGDANGRVTSQALS